ncbi:MAG: peptide deformylase [Pleurocapsa sp.]
MTTVLKIAQLGNPILRLKAQPVTQITDHGVSQLIDCLIATANSTKGVGIAAPQVSQSCRLFIVASHPSDRYPDAPKMQTIAMINPQIINHNDKIVKDWEGCLSIPGIRGLVPRYQQIEVEYTNKDGQLQHQILTDFVARIFQHELDHLDGKLFIDRIINEEDIYTEAEYQSINS